MFLEWRHEGETKQQFNLIFKDVLATAVIFFFVILQMHLIIIKVTIFYFSVLSGPVSHIMQETSTFSPGDRLVCGEEGA